MRRICLLLASFFAIGQQFYLARRIDDDLKFQLFFFQLFLARRFRRIAGAGCSCAFFLLVVDLLGLGIGFGLRRSVVRQNAADLDPFVLIILARIAYAGSVEETRPIFTEY